MSTFGNPYGRVGAVVLAFGLGTASYADRPTASAAAPPAASRAELIQQLIGDAGCNNDNECRVVGVGALACGGPEAYRAWSISRTDARTLEEAVARDAAIRKDEMEREGMRSKCSVPPVPEVMCARSANLGNAARCVLLSAGDARRR